MNCFAAALFVALSFAASGQPSPGEATGAFVENKGQWPGQVLFQTRSNGMDAWITKTGIVYNFYRVAEQRAEKTPGASRLQAGHSGTDGKCIGQAVFLELVNAGPAPQAEGGEKQSGSHNYFIGTDRSKWVTGAGLYHDVWVKGVYPGIDLHYYFEQGRLRYDYVLAAGADASRIGMEVRGTSRRARVNKAGELELPTRFGTVRQANMLAYQVRNGNREPVRCRFALDGHGRVRFVPGAYDRKAPLVIDPLLYATLLGGAGGEYPMAMARDAAGNVYVAGVAGSLDFPTTPGSYDRTPANGYEFPNAFVTKLNPDGSGLVYSTYLGGSGWDQVNALAVDAAGNVYVAGYTGSNFDYPVTPGCYGPQSHRHGDYEGFVTKLNDSGSALVYSTYLGGSDDDRVNALAIDASGNAYVAGETLSGDFPATAGSYDQTLDNDYDAFVTKLNASGSALLYSTFLGGTGVDAAHALIVDGSGNACVAGETKSREFPVTPGAYSRNFNQNEGRSDAFITKLNAAGSGFLYSTYLGGADDEVAYGLGTDASGNVYVAGRTLSPDFPVTPAAYQTKLKDSALSNHTYDELYGDGFVTKLSPDGSRLAYSTFLGGKYQDRINTLQVNGSGNAYVAGYTASYDFPTKAASVGRTQPGLASSDAFVSKLDTAGSGLVYSTFLGGSNSDHATALALDTSGHAYVAGVTDSRDFPTTAGSYCATFHGSGSSGYWDVFVAGLPISNCASLPSVKIARHRDTLVCPQTAGASCQWLSCGSAGPVPIAGATGRTLRISATAGYAIAVSVNGCRDTSECQTIGVGVEEIAPDRRTWSVGPNPSQGRFTITTGTPSVFELTDAAGRIVATYRVAARLEVKETLAPGVYLLRERGTGSVQKMVIR